jgi:hypothetical protein
VRDAWTAPPAPETSSVSRDGLSPPGSIAGQERTIRPGVAVSTHDRSSYGRSEVKISPDDEHLGAPQPGLAKGCMAPMTLVPGVEEAYRNRTFVQAAEIRRGVPVPIGVANAGTYSKLTGHSTTPSHI